MLEALLALATIGNIDTSINFDFSGDGEGNPITNLEDAYNAYNNLSNLEEK